MKKTNKKFDCLTFKRKAQRRIYKKIKDLSPADEVKYFRGRAASGPFGEWWKKATEKKVKSRAVAEKRKAFRKA